MKVEGWQVVFAGFFLLALVFMVVFIPMNSRSPDSPDPVVDAVDLIAMFRHVENMDSVYYRLSALSHQMDDSIAVLNEMVRYVENPYPESTLAYRWEHCGQVIDSLEQHIERLKNRRLRYYIDTTDGEGSQ